MTSGSYLDRRRRRLAAREQRSDIAFGIAAGWLMILYSLYDFLAVVRVGPDWPLALAPVGILLLAVTAAVPDVAGVMRRALTRAGRLVANALLAALLAIVYVVMVVPVGFLQRFIAGPAPYYQWNDKSIREFEGWVPFAPARPAKRNVGSRFLLLRQLAGVFVYFIRRRNVAYIPLLVLLVVLGLILFIAHSSAVAPLIYTLF